MGGGLENRPSAKAVEIRRVTKLFGQGAGAVTALDDVSLEIRDNEFFTLLGPSGCGKTTLLRLIAGFEEVSDGAILLFGEEIEDLPPNKRPVNTVFQHYALFPHMTVAENVGFSLRMLKRPRDEAAAVVQRMLALVKLERFAGRRPNQLSGGQQQRVALARALATRPKVLLLDEPLSALDLKLRQEMRNELKQIQQETGITFIFVTHDQEEALTMSDRIAVMSNGRVQQVGTAHAVYDRPVNRFVADFIGETNIIPVEIAEVVGGKARCVAARRQEFLCDAVPGCAAGQTVNVSIRPEKIALRRPDNGCALTGEVAALTYLGTDTRFTVRLDDALALRVRVQNGHAAEAPFARGDRVALSFDGDAARMLIE
jgi:spermidine/putrescine transport system ATP-binding protein